MSQGIKAMPITVRGEQAPFNAADLELIVSAPTHNRWYERDEHGRRDYARPTEALRRLVTLRASGLTLAACGEEFGIVREQVRREINRYERAVRRGLIKP